MQIRELGFVPLREVIHSPGAVDIGSGEFVVDAGDFDSSNLVDSVEASVDVAALVLENGVWRTFACHRWRSG